MEEIINNNNVKGLLTDIRHLLQEARGHIARTINTTLVNTYWQVGRHIVEYEQGGNARAEYSKGVINYLAEHLKREFGAGFNATNLRLMRRLFLFFPNQRTLSVKLSWSHYNYLLKIENKTARDYYMSECVACGWSTRQLERQINTNWDCVVRGEERYDGALHAARGAGPNLCRAVYDVYAQQGGTHRTAYGINSHLWKSGKNIS